MLTKSGQHVIFDITEFIPGKMIPREYLEYANQQDGSIRPWFFRLSSTTLEDGWGTHVGKMRGFPLMYSPGFATAEEALAAAEQWEKEKPAWRTLEGLSPDIDDDLYINYENGP